MRNSFPPSLKSFWFLILFCAVFSLNESLYNPLPFPLLKFHSDMPWFVSFFTHCTRSLLCFFSVETCILQFWELFFFIDLLSFSLSLLLEVLLFECWSSWTNLLLFVLFSISSCSFFFFGHNHVTCRLLVPWAGIEPAPPAVAVQSLNHWTTREVLLFALFSKNFLWKNFNSQKVSNHVMSPCVLIPQLQ